MLLVGASLIFAIHPTYPAVIGAQILLGGVGSLLGPVVTANTLGTVAASVFDKRFAVIRRSTPQGM